MCGSVGHHSLDVIGFICYMLCCYRLYIIKNNIFHNITICCEGEHFPIHLKKPLLKIRQKLVLRIKKYSVKEKLDLES